MTPEEIKRTWTQLIIPFVIGLVVLIVAIICHRFGSKRPGPQTLWLFVGMLGGVFTTVIGVKLIKFKRYLTTLDQDKNDDSN